MCNTYYAGHRQGAGHVSFRIIFFFNDTATTEIYTLSLHDALPICTSRTRCSSSGSGASSAAGSRFPWIARSGDRKSTRLNSSHGYISYAVFCLKKKKRQKRCRQRCSCHKFQLRGKQDHLFDEPRSL